MLTVSAQNSFLVYSFKGDVVVTENSVQSKAKVGKLLSENAQVIVPAGGVLMLICNQASLITVNKGKSTLADLKDQCGTEKQSVSSNYLRYVWTQLTTKPGTPEKNRKLFMTNVGAVSRGVNNVWIDPRFDTTYYVKGSFPLSWKSYAEAEEFTFALYDDAKGDKPLTTLTTKKHFVDIKDIAKNLTPGKMYYWTASVKGEQNPERKVIMLSTEEEYKSLVSTFEQMAPEGEMPAAKAFRIGFSLEQAHYLPEAYNYYKKAATLDGNVSVYKSTLDSFKKDYVIL
jgi:hypothetical protein